MYEVQKTSNFEFIFCILKLLSMIEANRLKCLLLKLEEEMVSADLDRNLAGRVTWSHDLTQTKHKQRLVTEQSHREEQGLKFC
jgi:hypothetical protein